MPARANLRLSDHSELLTAAQLISDYRFTPDQIARYTRTGLLAARVIADTAYYDRQDATTIQLALDNKNATTMQLAAGDRTR